MFDTHVRQTNFCGPILHIMMDGISLNLKAVKQGVESYDGFNIETDLDQTKVLHYPLHQYFFLPKRNEPSPIPPINVEGKKGVPFGRAFRGSYLD